MTEQHTKELQMWISRYFWRIEHWYDCLPHAAPLGESPVALASGTAAAELGFPINGSEFVTMWDQVADDKRSRLGDVCRRFHVRKLAGFGSAIRGSTHLKSDLDLLVEFEPQARIGFLALARLSDELASLFEVRVDLVPKDGLHPRIKDEVLAEAEVLFAA
jgi:predicted nucleotidyltransferase